jgi:hypothetical protein
MSNAALIIVAIVIVAILCGFHRFSPPEFTRIRHLNSRELAARFTGFGRAFHA